VTQILFHLGTNDFFDNDKLLHKEVNALHNTDKQAGLAPKKHKIFKRSPITTLTIARFYLITATKKY